MTKKKATTTPMKGRKAKVVEADSQSLLLSLSLPGIVLAAGVALWYQSRSGNNHISGGGGVGNSDSVLQQEQPSYYTPTLGSWDDGYYSSPIDQNFPSTHAILYPNGGIGEPTEAIFQSEEDFLSAGRLYNELGQIVQNRFHFENGTV